jgi:hypothetical protein
MVYSRGADIIVAIAVIGLSVSEGLIILKIYRGFRILGCIVEGF